MVLRKKTSHHIQPARLIMRDRKLAIAKVAGELGVSASHLNDAIHGRRAPSQEVIDGLPKILDMPIEKLFDDWLLRPHTTLEELERRNARWLRPGETS